ncbi:MAG TPA: hypothetical protein VKE40_02400 [Gemmataceae bacterium]|nr:hypothetical protein [Gemmataceae bacterium]
MRRLTSLALLGVGLAAAGCGDGGPKLVPVEGRVTLDGKPVKEMLINFHPVGDTYGTGANAMTDADGRFTLMDSRGGDGAYAGEYKVSFYPALGRRQEGDPSTDVVNDGSKGGFPRIYLDADKSPLRTTIPEGGGTAEVILTSSGKDAAVKFQPRGGR